MNLLIRTDASVSIGTGHVMRCLALAQAWQDQGGHAIFLMSETTPAVEARLRAEGMHVVSSRFSVGSVQDSTNTADVAVENGADWVVVDGYRFGAEFQRAIKNSGQKLLFIDDNGHAEHYSADLVLNQNVHAKEAFYVLRSAQTRVLLGPMYALLRREFIPWRGWNREIPPSPKKVLVSLGGSDPQNITQLVIRALQQIAEEGLQIIVIAGGSNPHVEELSRYIVSSPLDIQLISNSTNMAELMAAVDFSISGAGSTCWEMCLMGLPAIIIDLAPNQTLLARSLNSIRAAVHLPIETVNADTLSRQVTRFLNSPEMLTSLSASARELVDGNGSTRVAALMKHEIRLRPTEQSDCRLLWEWANDPQVRAMSFSAESIPWDQHVKWFNSRLGDPWARLYVASDHTDQPIGQVRHQLAGDRADLSLNLGCQFRGKGYGKAMLLLATEELFRHSQVRTIDAFVKPGNAPSLRLFEAAGFRSLGMKDFHGQQAVHFVLSRNFR